jgi:parallel beta-helix repeat protein
MRVELHSIRLWFFSLAVLVACASLPAQTQTQAQPLGTVAVGDSPFALALASGNQQAVVVNLFPTRVQQPDGTFVDGPNVRVLDVINRSQLRAFRAGTRLVSIAVTGATALVVNEDQDVIRVLDVNSGTEVAQIPVGSRPSNVVTSGANTAVATNGTSGDVSFIDIAGRRVVGSRIPVGKDPRAVAVHPTNQRYAYIALGGDNSVAVLDQGVTPQQVVNKVPVGKNPVAIAITPDGRRAVVANLTNNTVTVLDVSNPASPQSLFQVPVGVQPTAVEINPLNSNLVYVANLGSNFFSVLDLSKTSAKDVLIGVVQMNAASSAIRISSDATHLFVSEFKNQANLRIYDLRNMPLGAKLTIDIPGEPRFVPYLNSTGDCSSSFYIAEATLVSGQKEGFWGMEVLVSQGELTGGFNLGGGFEGNGQFPGFGAFSLATAQQVTVRVDAQQLPGTTSQVALTVDVLKDNNRIAGTSGAPPLTFTTPNLDPGFYVVRLSSAAGSPRGTFQMSLTARAFSGGVVVGGFIASGLTGFGAFCVPQSQNVDMHLVGGSEYGASAAGDLILTARDSQRNVIRSLNNSVSAPPPADPPSAPSTSGLNIRWYVEAAAAAGGDGSSSRPFNSITRAIAAAQSGDVIFVRAGVYSPSKTQEQIPIGSQGIGTNGLRSNVTLLGAGAATTIIDGESYTRSDGNGNAVVIPASGVRMAGFTVRKAAQVGIYVYHADNVIIENNLLTSNIRFGIGSEGSRGLVVRNNVAVSNLESGMAFSGATGLAIANAPNNCPASPAGAYGAYVINNISQDNRADGILISAGGNVCVANNTTNNNGSSGIELNNRVEGGTVPALNGVIVNNQLTGNGGVQFGFAGTGILVTENNATADIISGNKLVNNRPFGIGIFLNGRAGTISNNTVSDTQNQGILVQKQSTADEISDNTVRNSGLSGVFIENGATVSRVLRNVSTDNGTGVSILNGSRVTTLDGNTCNNNGVAMELAAGGSGLPGGQADAVTNNTFDNSATGGVYVRESSRIGNFGNNKVRNGRGSGMMIDASTATLANSELSSNANGGLSLYNNNATANIQSCIINANKAGALSATGGAQATLTGTTISGNTGDQAVLAAGAGSSVRLNGGNSIINNQGWGLNAQNGGAISCSGANTVSGNTSGNMLGSISGCQ